jgi:hypothetical protein
MTVEHGVLKALIDHSIDAFVASYLAVFHGHLSLLSFYQAA